MLIKMNEQQVKHWMRYDPTIVASNTTLPEACRLMKKHGIRHLPVVDGGELVGIVSSGDVRRASASDVTPLCSFELDYLLAKMRVSMIMTRDPITVRPTTPISRACQLMKEHKIDCLPVVEFGKLVGIITERDIFRMVVMGKAA
jgi:CBS domain-containing protein